MNIETTSPSRTGTLLGVWAHPDDEAFLSAALMARSRQAGERVVVATATRGERGTVDPTTWPPARLGELRERELTRSLELLGVHEHHWLGHTDGLLPVVDGRRAVAQVASLIDDVDPDTVVTFGPDGMTGHDDHRTVSTWVTRAWHATGRRSRLWYATVTPAFHEIWGPVNAAVGLWFDGTRPPLTRRRELAAQVVCDHALLDLKYAALRAHASQTDGLVAALGESRFRRWWAVESFVAAQQGAPEAVGEASSRAGR